MRYMEAVPPEVLHANIGPMFKQRWGGAPLTTSVVRPGGQGALAGAGASGGRSYPAEEQ